MEPFDHQSLAENILAGVYLIFAFGLPASVAVRLATAPFSRRIRGSILRHPILHVMWLLLGMLAAYDLLSILLVRWKG